MEKKMNNQEQNHEHEHNHEHEDWHQARQEFRDFWRDWRDEQRQFFHEFRPDMRHGMGHPPSSEEVDAWREFFHKTMGNWPERHWIFGGRRFSPWHQGMDSFNPFVASLLSKGGGLLPLYVMHLVSQKPRYGNEIMEILAERTGGQWVANPGAIYPLLTLLERQGFIEGQWEDPQKRTVRIYTLTKTGADELARLKAIVSPKIAETIKVLQDFIQDMDKETATQPPQGTENI
jgi:DNA-binding PadR family transcriptional regulator